MGSRWMGLPACEAVRVNGEEAEGWTRAFAILSICQGAAVEEEIREVRRRVVDRACDEGWKCIVVYVYI